ncbi:MAG: Malonyl CoA-acyl carrier protein transacylase [Chlamydiia bacterium]|nr:Malonyl CoA-acyl carrier protein transacylase [Chlamydiia bacterium]MCH9615874.1 Malonyl CoA-acyl carrier protein transacylase [Chlamydiia bacterium]MCH9628723.1 Malonyl CoA-acyl carrier protein transacylase [Chlamydiia bacterium]
MVKRVILFPGQGAQYVGMGKDFYDQFAICRETFEEASEIIGYDLAKLVFEGPAETLMLTKHSQIAIFVTSMAIWRAVISQFPDLEYQMTAGLSLGEYTALVAAGYLSFAEGVRLVQLRGELMHQASTDHPGTMAVVLGLEVGVIEEEISSLDCYVANLNCPGQVVISGSIDAIDSASTKLKERGARRVLPLGVSGAFHSPLMKSAQDGLAPKIRETNFHPSSIKTIMNVPGDLVESTQKMKDFLIEQVAAPTYWEKGIRNMLEMGVQDALEIGPGKTLTGMNKKIGASASNIQKLEDLDAFIERQESINYGGHVGAR